MPMHENCHARNYDAEFIALVRHHAGSGLNYQQIAQKTNISAKVISSFCKRHRITIKRKHNTGKYGVHLGDGEPWRPRPVPKTATRLLRKWDFSRDNLAIRD